jgi:hypothetical protein
MRTSMQLVLSILFLALTAAPARADLIIYDMFGAVGALYPGGNPLPGLGISEGDPIHLVVHVDYDAPDLCGQPGQGLYPLPFAEMELNGTIYSQDPQQFGGFVEVNNGAGNCSMPGGDGTGVAIRLLIGSTGMTLFGPGQVGETLPNPLFSDGVGGFFGLAGTGQFADVLFDDIRAQEVVPEPATLLLLSGGLAALVSRRRRQL